MVVVSGLGISAGLGVLPATNIVKQHQSGETDSKGARRIRGLLIRLNSWPFSNAAVEEATTPLLKFLNKDIIR